MRIAVLISKKLNSESELPDVFASFGKEVESLTKKGFVMQVIREPDDECIDDFLDEEFWKA